MSSDTRKRTEGIMMNKEKPSLDKKWCKYCPHRFYAVIAAQEKCDNCIPTNFMLTESQRRKLEK